MPLLWTELFPYPDGDLVGENAWAAFGALASPQVLGTDACFGDGTPRAAQNPCDNLPFDMLKPWNFTFELNRLAFGTGGDEVVQFNAGGSVFVGVRFEKGTGTTLNISLYDATGIPATLTNSSVIPQGVQTTCELLFDGTDLIFKSGGVTRLTKASADLTGINPLLEVGGTTGATTDIDAFAIPEFFMTGSS